MLLTKQLLDVVEGYYSEPHREYHSIEHIHYMLKHFDNFKKKTNIIDEKEEIALEIAIIFHDVIYNPLSKENEYKSAKFALDYIKNNHKNLFPKYTIEEVGYISNLVYKLIISTKTPFSPERFIEINNSDRMEAFCIKLIHDLDFHSLSENYKNFKKRMKQTRMEYITYYNATTNEEPLEDNLNIINKQKLFFLKLQNGLEDKFFKTDFFSHLNEKTNKNIYKFINENIKP